MNGGKGSLLLFNKFVNQKRGIDMDLKIHHNFDSANIDEMREVYESVGWMKHTNEIIRQVFEASNVIAIVTVNGRIIGFGRAMTDGVFNAAIYDIVVHRDFQRQGIGEKLWSIYLINLVIFLVYI
jgi:ribosomal protein S18 acetylase RimI-like enzyme